MSADPFEKAGSAARGWSPCGKNLATAAYQFAQPSRGATKLPLAIIAALSSAMAPAADAQTTAPAVELEEITVVAQKRAEQAQRTPLSMTVITADGLSTISAQKFGDIQYLTPGLRFEGSSNNQYAAEINIRGQESNQQLLGIDPSVGIYVDGVYQTSTIGVNLGNIYGLDHIEVLKGPQGTLYGRNTTGGALNVITREPSDTLTAGLQQEFGSYGLTTTTGNLNTPIVPGKASLRLDGQFSVRSGYSSNLTDNAELGNSRTGSLRGTLRLTPTADWEILLRGDYLHARGGGELFQPIGVEPNSLGAQLIARTAGVPVQQAPQAFLATGGGQAANLDPKAYDFPENDRFVASGGSLTVKRHFDSVTLSSISAYRNFQHDNAEDLDASVFNILSARNSQAQDQYTEELQLTGGEPRDRLNYVAGIYYYDTTAKDDADSSALGATTPTLYRNHLTDESVAAYGQTTFAITSDIHLRTGLRWTTETKGLDTQNSTGALCNIPAVDRLGSSCVGKFSTSDANTSYSVGLDYTLSDTVLLYFNSGRGFKSGGINERGTATNGSYAIFRPEIATNYELGVKSDWLDHRVRLNLDAYHTDYDDIQRSATVLSPSGAAVSVTTNAARATIDGAEIETALVPFQNALLAATAAFIDPIYTSFTDALGDHTNQRFEGVSRWTYGLSARYAVPVSFGNLAAQVNWFWQSSEELSPAATGVDVPANHIQDAYGLLGARITWRAPAIGTEVSLYGTNLLHRLYFVSILDLATNVPARAIGTSIGQVGAPRTFGIVLSKNF